MKNKLTLLLTLLVFSLHTYSQSKKAIAGQFMFYFEENYNKELYGKIYNRFTAPFQKKVSKEKWNSILSEFQTKYGKIKYFNFIEVSQAAVRFNVKFEKGNQRFKIYPSEQILNKLDAFLYRDNPVLEKNISKITLPFKEGKWWVMQGGDTKKQNNHQTINYQKNAFDFVLLNKDSKRYTGNRRQNENHFSFGKEVIAPVEGEIVSVINGVKDNIPGHINRYYYSGNTVILKTKNNEFLFFGHLKNQSIKVKVGDKVTKGQTLAQIGNSGASYYPQLHFHVQNIEDINGADGVKCFFDKVNVNGNEKSNYSPVKGDIISN
ncbi:peptidoglycan DD-metalloendopeptidase family protein [uncultured Tenacibaculum sp.]|uniref:peptidoglycan DD-metalloendopeptidase family protein n=1 Tax=uncultured Tenacibaculum sp. TaxID=174713 RepID=UPI00260BE1E7|nr:peptidoglycan DD-metalloendopeptidase family protein [uncultured Tenacibaculum sp.]